VRSGGRSGSGEVVPGFLLTSRKEKQAHEHRGNEGSSKQTLARRGTDWSDVPTRRVSRRRHRPDLKKKGKLRRLRGLGSELGVALGSQEGGEYGKVLNLTREGVVVMNLEERDRRLPWLRTEGMHGVVHVGAQVERKASPRHPRRLATLTASSCVHARMRAALLARRVRWTGRR